MVTRRQGGRSNSHQPLTSDDIYPHDHKWKYCSHFYTSSDDDWSIQSKYPDKSFSYRSENLISFQFCSSQLRQRFLILSYRSENLISFSILQEPSTEKPLKIITFHCVASVIILFWWSISLQFVYGKTSKQPYKLETSWRVRIYFQCYGYTPALEHVQR